MRLQMGGVDHQPSRLAGLARQLGENLVEHAKTAPADEPIVDRLVRTVVARSIAPAQPIPDDEDDPADLSAGHQPWECHATAENNGSIRRICASESKNKSSMATPPRAAI